MDDVGPAAAQVQEGVGDPVMTLLDNILAQREQMRAMGKTPTTLRVDSTTFDVLLKELAPFLGYPLSTEREIRIYGLRVEISPEPDFEVI